MKNNIDIRKLKLFCLIISANIELILFTKGLYNGCQDIKTLYIIIAIVVIQIIVFMTIRYKQTLKDIYQEHFGSILFIVFVLLCTFLIFILEQDYKKWGELNQKTFIDFFIEMLKGFLSTLVGMWFCLKLLKPRLKIYPYICLYESQGRDGRKIIKGQILVKNQTYNNCFDVKILLQGCWTDENGNLKTKTIDIANDEIALLKNRFVKNENTYAWHTKDDISDRLFCFDYLRCRISATHSISGIHFIKEKIFYSKDCKIGHYNNDNKFIEQ